MFSSVKTYLLWLLQKWKPKTRKANRPANCRSVLGGHSSFPVMKGVDGGCHSTWGSFTYDMSADLLVPGTASWPVQILPWPVDLLEWFVGQLRFQASYQASWEAKSELKAGLRSHVSMKLVKLAGSLCTIQSHIATLEIWKPAIIPTLFWFKFKVHTLFQVASKLSCVSLTQFCSTRFLL